MTALRRVWPGIALTALSLLLFAYVGYGEAIRVYVQIRLERIEQLGATVQGTVGQFAKSGLPLDQFGGYDRRSQQIRSVDSSILATSLVDVDGKPIFCEADPDRRDALCQPERNVDNTHARWMAAPLRGDTGADMAVSLPVSDKFGKVGSVLLHVDRSRIEQVVDAAFKPVFVASIVLLVLFTAIRLLVYHRRGESEPQRWLAPLFLAVIAINLAVMIAVMFDLYRKGTEGQAEALARSMASRLAAVTDIGIPLSALSGIHEAFDEYRRINPNIAAISLNDRNKVLISVEDTGPGSNLFGAKLERLVFDLPVEKTPEHDLVLSVELPLSVVLAALGAGARNFIALFFGCAVLALVFLKAIREGTGTSGATNTGKLALLRPAYFLGIFADALSLSILPEIAKETAAAEGLPTEWVSLPFTLFFVGLTAALLPASYVTGRVEVRRLFMAGAGAVGAGLFLASLVPDFWALCAGRMLSGIGQGTLLVAVQAYAFEVVGDGQRTRAAAVQVLGYNGGLIVGTGLGGLLAVFNADRDVLFVGGLVAVGACVYIRFVLPALARHEPDQAARVSLLGSIGRLAKAPDFMAVLGLVGITSKFALAGIAMFAMPLVLHQAGYGDDEVGQALMVFAVVTYLVTGVAPRLVGRVGSIDGVLTVGMLMLALGIGLLGLLVVPAGGVTASPAFVPIWLLATAADLQAAVGSSALPIATGLAVMIAIAALGVGQGLIAAPVIARVADSRVAQTVGRERTLAVYRLAERAGHILGPTLVGPVLLAAHGDAIPLAIFAMIFAGLAVIYGIWSLVGRTQAA